MDPWSGSKDPTGLGTRKPKLKKKKNRSNILTNSIKTFKKMVHIKKIFEKVSKNKTHIVKSHP